ncbi:hypothetical protein A2U01_0065678, partial [Trifolium medium]|nr:hypothetical protein [Trifolium medium]
WTGRLQLSVVPSSFCSDRLKQLEKTGGNRSLDSKVAIKVFIFGKGNVDKPLRGQEQGHRDHGFESRLCEGKVLAPLTTVVSNGNR